MKSIRDLKFWLKQALWLVPCAYLANFIYAIQSDQTGGTFGDTFGAANALFSGTALLMLVLAVILQREELEQVKEERNDTRDLLKGQEDFNATQKLALDRQIFEQTFGSLINAALTERNRLSVEHMVKEKIQKSEYFYAGFFSARLLDEIADGEDLSTLSTGGNNGLADKNFIYVSMLVHMFGLIENSEIDIVTRDSLHILLKSLFDEPCAYCMAWYIVRMSIIHTEIELFETVFRSYRLIDSLNGKPLEAFLTIKSDFKIPS